MKNCLRNAYILCALVLCASPVFGQTEQEIKDKYGKPIRVYSVDDNIWMSATYTSDGQVCEMTLYPKRVSENSTYLGSLPASELKRTLEKIAPPSERGKEIISGLTWIGGGIATRVDSYENINIMSLSRFHSENMKFEEPSTIEQRDETIDIDLQVKAKGRRLAVLPDPEPPEVVVITWRGRKRCEK